MPMFVKMGIGTQGYMTGGGSTRRAAAKRAARRAIRPGYPRETPFETKQEIDEYLSRDTVECLLCGHRMRRVSGSHLQKIHGMSEEVYRLKYNIPMNAGLVSASSQKEYADAALRRNAIEALGGLRKGPPRGIRPRLTELETRERTQRILSAQHLTEYAPEHFEEFLRLLGLGHSATFIAAMEGMPGRSAWWDYRRRNSDYDARCRAMLRSYTSGKRRTDRARAGLVAIVRDHARPGDTISGLARRASIKPITLHRRMQTNPDIRAAFEEIAKKSASANRAGRTRRRGTSN
jgi:predicted transcriptional regulator